MILGQGGEGAISRLVKAWNQTIAGFRSRNASLHIPTHLINDTTSTALPLPNTHKQAHKYTPTQGGTDTEASNNTGPAPELKGISRRALSRGLRQHRPLPSTENAVSRETRLSRAKDSYCHLEKWTSYCTAHTQPHLHLPTEQQAASTPGTSLHLKSPPAHSLTHTHHLRELTWSL